MEYDQSRLVVNLEQATIDDINNQVSIKQGILSDDPGYQFFREFVDNIRIILYALVDWLRNPSSVQMSSVVFKGWRPFSLVLFIALIIFAILMLSCRNC